MRVMLLCRSVERVQVTSISATQAIAPFYGHSTDGKFKELVISLL